MGAGHHLASSRSWQAGKGLGESLVLTRQGRDEAGGSGDGEGSEDSLKNGGLPCEEPKGSQEPGGGKGGRRRGRLQTRRVPWSRKCHSLAWPSARERPTAPIRKWPLWNISSVLVPNTSFFRMWNPVLYAVYEGSPAIQAGAVYLPQDVHYGTSSDGTTSCTIGPRI